MSYPYCYWGQHVNSSPFSQWNRRNNWCWCVRLVAIGVSARPLMAFSGFYESHKPPPSVDARGIVPPHCDDHRNGQQSGYMLHHRWVDCRPGGRLGDTERVVARWRRPVASGKALVMLNWVMCSVLLQCIRFAIEMARNRGTFVRCHLLFWLL